VDTRIGVVFVLGADGLVRDPLQQVLIDRDVGTEFGLTDREQVVGRQCANRG
jgi:hypothetical protein